MRVVLVGNHWTDGPGGAETMLQLTAALLREAGAEVVPFAVAEERTLPTPAGDRLPPPAGSTARTRFGEAWAGTWSPRAYRALAAVVDEVRPDVAHVHHVFERLTVSVLDVLRRRGVPTVMTLHDYKPVCPNYRLFTDGAPCTRCLSGRYLEVVRHRCLEGSRWRSVAAAADAYAARARGLYDRVDRFLAPSAFLRDRVVEGGLPADRVRVLPNPVVARPRTAPRWRRPAVPAVRRSPRSGEGHRRVARRHAPAARRCPAASGRGRSHGTSGAGAGGRPGPAGRRAGVADAPGGGCPAPGGGGRRAAGAVVGELPDGGAGGRGPGRSGGGLGRGRHPRTR